MFENAIAVNLSNIQWVESCPGSLQINHFPETTGTGVLSAAVDLRSEIAEGIKTSDELAMC